MSATTSPVASSKSSRPGAIYFNNTHHIHCCDIELEPKVGDVVNGSPTVVTLFEDVTDLIPYVGPPYRVLEATKGLNRVVNEMPNNPNKTSCESLEERILLFLKNLVEDSERADVPLTEGSPAAAKLFVLSL